MQQIPAIATYYSRSLEEIRGKNDPESLKAAAREMESLFAYELIKAMRATAELTSSNNLGKSTFMSMFDLELARLLAQKGLGLQDLLLKELQKDAARDVRPQSDRELSSSDSSGNPISTRQTPSVDSFSPPVHGIITSLFGIRKHPIYGDNRFHYGVDIAAPTGTDIFPVRRGRVLFSGQQGGYGNMVIIDHGNGLISKYAHNQCNLVQEGDDVDTDTVIARVGETGNTTGPHLHFEITDDGFHIDPVQLIARKQD